MIASILQSVVLGWLWRRLQEVVAWAFGLIPLYLAMPPEFQDLVRGILTGQGGGYSISVYLGFAYYLFTQWQSYRATVVPQVVTTAGTKFTPDPSSVAQERIETQAKVAPRRKTLFEQWFGL